MKTARSQKVSASAWPVFHLRGLVIKKAGPRNLQAEQARAWTQERFNGHGLYRLGGTRRYSKAA
jgi:RNA-directed DNA polymerase